MNPNFDWNQFELVNPEPQDQSPEGIDWNQFQLVDQEEPTQQEPPKQKPQEKPYDNRIEYLRKHGASEEDIAEFEAENAGVEFQGSKKALKETPRGLISGAIAGYSEMIPGFKPEGFEGGTAKVIGSLAPIGAAAKLLSYPLKAAASKSPVIMKGLQSFADLVGLSTAGGVYGALEESSKNSAEQGTFVPPSLDDVLKHGATWAALDASLKALGWTGRFGKALIEKATSSGVPAEKILEDIASQVGTDKAAEKAISILENKPLEAVEKEIKLSKGNAPSKEEVLAQKEFSSRVQERGADLKNKKISQKDLEALDSGEAAVPKPYLPSEIKIESIAEENLFKDIDQQIERISPRADSHKELGESVQKEIENSITEHKKKTDELYDIAKEVESTRSPRVKKTADSIVEEIKKIESGGITLTPEGYNKAKSQLVTTLTDLGYGVETDANGLIVKAIEHQKQPLSKIIEVKRRLNKILNYDLLDTSAQDFLKNPARELRGEIREGYGPKNSKARKAFEKAEKEFGEFAEKKGKQSISNMRSSEKPETLVKTIRTPSGLADIKEVVSKEQFSQIEREILEHLKGLKEENASNLYRELRQSLSPESRSVGEQIIEAKTPKESPLRVVSQRNNLKQKIIDDLSQATLTGQRPKVALDLWKTKEGQQLIKESLENSPNKKEVLKYLQDQSFKDFSASVVDVEGKIDFKKLNDMLKDPATVSNIRLVAGEEGVSFLKNLETLSKHAEKNASILERTISKGTASERKKIRDEVDKLGKQRLEQIKQKNTKLTKEEEIFQSKFDKQAKKDRAETNESLEAKGKERIRKSKEKRIELTKKEKDAEEALEKSGILYKIDDLVNSYGFKGKGLLTALGIWKIGTVEGLTLAASYEIFSRLAKNKNVRDAVKRAAISPKDNISILRAITGIEKAMDSKD